MGNCCLPTKEKAPVHLETKSIHNSFRDTKNFRLSPADFIKLSYRPVSKEYSCDSVIGTGSFGEVWLATHIDTRSKRAIKQIFLSDSDSGESQLEKLLKEVSILKCLDHPNIIRVFEVYKNKNRLSIVTEYCSGGELFERIQKIKRFSENLAAKYMLDIVSAVMHCHDCDIVHRDLKPENLLFEDDSEGAQLKLIDFGTSRFIPDDKKLRKPIGTCYYMAPEVLTSEYGKKVDVWSLGVILFAMLSGNVPFPGKSDQEIFTKIKNAPLTFSQPCWSSISDEAKFLIRKMLEKRPENRFSIEDVYNDPWLQDRGNNRVPDKEIQAETLKSLSTFRVEGRLQKAVYIYIVTQFLENKHFEELKHVFLSVDKNGDGFLSEEEIIKATEEFNFHFNMKDILVHCDHDKNGFINYSEFLTATVNKSQAYTKEHLASAFKRFDRNGDGKIDLEELKLAIGGNSSDSVFRQMIAEADKNNDGVIDVNEFISHMNQYAQDLGINN